MTLVDSLWVLTCLISLFNLFLVIRNHRRQKRRMAEWMAELEADA